MASSCELVRHGDVTLIRCQGRIVHGETDQLRNAALNAVENTGRIVVDLSEVSYIDSTGLGLLAFLCVSARRRAGDMKLVAPSEQVAGVLESTMLGRVFAVYPTEKAALAAFAAPAPASRSGKH